MTGWRVGEGLLNKRLLEPETKLGYICANRWTKNRYGGPSFGNNANNRCEEALESGLDLSVAQREGLLGAGAAPFIGYCILVEDEEKSRSIPKRGNPSVHFDSDPVFKTASYQGRMRILCERMVQERLYTAAAVLTSPPTPAKSGDFADLSTTTSLNRLLQKFLAHIQIETND